MYGETIKEIRKMKGFAQKEVYTDVVSKTFYSDFEKGKYSISLEKFAGILGNLGLSFEEFFYFHHGLDISEREKLELEIDGLYQVGNFEALFTLYESYSASNKRELRYLAAKAYLLVLITNSNFYKFSREPFNEIKANLENTKSWTRDEIKLGKLVLLSLPEKEAKQASILFERIKTELKKYKNFENKLYEKELTDLFFNRIQSLLILNQIKEAETVLKDYSKVAHQADDITLFIQFRFISYLLNLYTNYPQAEKKMQLFLKQVAEIPVSECHFYKIIFKLHQEKAKNYYQRYKG